MKYGTETSGGTLHYDPVTKRWSVRTALVGMRELVPALQSKPAMESEGAPVACTLSGVAGCPASFVVVDYHFVGSVG